MNQAEDVLFTPYYLSKNSLEAISKIHDFLYMHYGIYYLSYFCELPLFRIRVSFSSNSDWQEVYVKDNLIEECHLYKAVNKFLYHMDNKNLIFLWDTIQPRTSNEKEIAIYRNEKGIGYNGVSFCQRSSNFCEILGLAPEWNNLKFAATISENLHSIKRSLLSIRFIIKNNLEIYRPQRTQLYSFEERDSYHKKNKRGQQSNIIIFPK